MPTLSDVVAFCDQVTRLDAYTDAPGAFNGLQVANSGRVTRIGAAVDAGAGPFTRAVADGVDFLIVHHGLYWDMPRALTGTAYARLATLVRGDCALYSNHLPLDGHPTLGNNALLARQLGLDPSLPFLIREGQPIGWAATFSDGRDDLRASLRQFYPRLTAIEYGSLRPTRIAFCSGSGNSAVPELMRAGIDTLVTGELREEWYNVAEEQRLNLYLCGHYATETHGVRALAAAAAAQFGVPWTFIATDNPL
jgi:dinuclear metal center YbgI/SA1388 family protein